jgi:uncharacterized membrane protein YuzA (DUF378 family)
MCCCHSPFGKIVGLIAWLITALAAINVGLMPVGYDFFKLPFVQNNLQSLIVPLYYLIGVAGVISLVGFFIVLTSESHCGCHKD